MAFIDKTSYSKIVIAGDRLWLFEFEKAFDYSNSWKIGRSSQDTKVAFVRRVWANYGQWFDCKKKRLNLVLLH